MKTLAINAPMQLRKKIHIGSFMDIIFLDLIKKYHIPNIDIVIEWNALGMFRKKDNTLIHNDMISLHAQMSGIINQYFGLGQMPFHYIDDSDTTFDITKNIVIELIEKDKVFIKKYESLYCKKCNSYIGSMIHPSGVCKICSTKLISKETTDIFIRTNMKDVIKNAKDSNFYPAYTKKKFLGGILQMPSTYPITKSREHGLFASKIESSLKGKVLDPKFIFSLFPIIAKRLGLKDVSTVVIGEDILVRYLYYLFANSGLLQPISLDIFIHGMFVSKGKKISKYNNLPKIVDINGFLNKWSWDHLKLLSLSSVFGKNIDFNEKIIEVQKLIIKRKNVKFFLEIIINQNKLDSNPKSDLEKKIIERCESLTWFLQKFDLHKFYKGYQDLWFNLLSREYISNLKKGIGSVSGLLEINEKINSLF